MTRNVPELAFGQLLLAHRRTAGITQAELAAASGASVRVISELECGRSHGPQRATVDSLARALGLPPEAVDTLHRAAAEARSRRRPAGTT